MFVVQTLNKIAPEGLKMLPKDIYEVSDECLAPDAILVRSAKLHDMELPPSLKAIARAGAGVNNIPVEKCSEQGIVVFNTPGANANAVKELVMAGLLMVSRDIAGGIQWVRSQTADGDLAKVVEKGKSAFGGIEVAGKTLGVVGLGAIGVMVANAAIDLGMSVIGFDPYISVESAWGLNSNVEHATDIDKLFSQSDFITLHIPLVDDTVGYIGEDAFAKMRPGVRLLNFARGELVDNAALAAALESGRCARYVTDFPGTLTQELLAHKSVVPIPHLGASTEESEMNCAVMAVNQLRDFLENGNIVNSVNFPDCAMERTGAKRLISANRNVPNMVGQITSVLAQFGLNITNMVNKSRQDYAYTIVDVDGDFPGAVVERILAIPDVLMARVIR
jgi:D-3-phosphoglycerate dehydrogenase